MSHAKECIESLKASGEPDLIFTHELHDRHQDHRVVSELTWNTFRDHVILEYEIPKYESALGQPNLYVPVSNVVAERKARHLLNAYLTQKTKRWFSRETFFALMHLRGIECNAEHGLAEAFHARKLVIESRDHGVRSCRYHRQNGRTYVGSLDASCRINPVLSLRPS